MKYRDGTTTVDKPFPLTIKLEVNELSILSDAEQKQLQQFLGELDDVGSNVSFVRYMVPWFRNWRSSLPQHFLPVDADLSAVDDVARARLDKLKDI